MVRSKNLVDFTCQKCDKTMKIEKWRIKPTRKYCSKECQYAAARKLKPVKEKKLKKIKPIKIKKEKKINFFVCAFCLIEFSSDKKERKYCSQSCVSKHYHSKKKAEKFAKAVPLLESNKKIPNWNIQVYLDKELSKEFQHEGTVEGTINLLIAQIKPTEKFKRMDIHIRMLND